MHKQQLTNSNKHVPIYFPTHPTNAYNSHLSAPIAAYANSYHCGPWIAFTDNIQYHENQEYLKRYYGTDEWHTKIKLLADYYRFHFQVPRLFMDGVGRILQENIEDRREIQFELVTNEMNKEKDCNQMPMTTHRLISKHEKLIKDIQLSYDDFEEKPVKKTKETSRNKREIRIQRSNSHVSLSKPLTRVDSIKCKGSYLVFKPRSQPIVDKEQNRSRKNIEPKYKKPKQIKEKHKENKIKQDLHKITKKQNSQKQKSKCTSKFTSINNSLASHKGLSRSKSRAHLNIEGLKNIEGKIKNQNTQNSVKNHKLGVHVQSLTKCSSKNQILGEKRGSVNTMSRKESKMDLKIEDKQYLKKSLKNIENENPRYPHRRQIQLQSQFNKKMFSKALQIKKRKQ